MPGSPLMRAFVIVLLVVSAGCHRTKPTPAGAELVRWDRAAETDPAIVAAKEVGPRAHADVTLVAKPNVAGPITLAVHFDTAPLSITVDGDTEQASAPVSANIVVSANDDWELSSQCNEGIHRKLGQERTMIKSCHVSMRHGDRSVDAHLGFDVDLRGDGTVSADEPGFAFTTTK